MAPTLPEYEDPDSHGTDRSAARWNAHLRFALNYRALLKVVRKLARAHLALRYMIHFCRSLSCP